MQTSFTWGWGDYPRQPDNLMTRQRMAVLLRAWRRAKLNHCGRHVNVVRLLERRPGSRVYSVVNTPTGERCTFEVRRIA